MSYIGYLTVESLGNKPNAEFDISDMALTKSVQLSSYWGVKPDTYFCFTVYVLRRGELAPQIPTLYSEVKKKTNYLGSLSQVSHRFKGNKETAEGRCLRKDCICKFSLGVSQKKPIVCL